MKTTTEQRMRNPPHPGDFLRTEVIEPRGLSVTEAAEQLNVSRPALSNLLNGKANLSGEMALRIEKVYDIKMETLLRMQNSYDIAQTRLHADEILRRRAPILLARHAGRPAQIVRRSKVTQ